MCGKVDREHVEDDIKSAIRVEIKVSNEAKGPLPCGPCTGCDSLGGLDRVSGGRRVSGAQAACELSRELAVPLGLFAEQVELVLLIAVAE